MAGRPFTKQTLDDVDEHYTVPWAAGSGAGGLTFQVVVASGTFTGVFECRIRANSDGDQPDTATEWKALLVTPSSSDTKVDTTSAEGVFRVVADGLDVRFRLTVVGPGAVDVYCVPSSEN